MTRIRNSIPPHGDNLPVICVLEDTPARIEWLEDNFPDVHVAWSTTVLDFCASVDALALSGRLQLILMDHDLGFNPVDLMDVTLPASRNYMEDRNGHDGCDACWSMTPHSNIPVFIWSANYDKAPTMEAILRRQGFLRVSRASFDSHQDEIKQFIENTIGL
jgi:hypothetical protein